MFSQKTLLSKLPEIIGKLRDTYGSCYYSVNFVDDKLHISDGSDTINSDIVDTIKKVTEKQEIPWEITISDDKLVIVLGDES